MSFFSKLRLVALFVAALIVAGARVEAQNFFGLSVTNSASSILVSNSLTYTITVTNLGGDLLDTVVSNTLSSSFQFVSATPSLGGSVATNGNVVVFDLGIFDLGGVAQMTLTVQPTAAGFITNLVIVASTFVTNNAVTNVVTQVTNTISPQADLGVAITVPTTAIIANDFMAYGVSVTNSGPNSAPNVFLTNTLPAGVILKSVLPANQTYTVASSNLIFNLGTLNSNAVSNLQFTIQPTNAGALNFFASVGAAGVVDTNTANNSASNSFIVINYLPGDLAAATNSAQIPNPQNGLIEQSILVSNLGTNAVAAVRVVVTGLTNRLYNASGTNGSSPFVVYTAGLATNQSVTLLLQYVPRKNFPFTNSQLQAYAVPVPSLTLPVGTSGTNVTISRIVKLSNGDMLVEFPAITNRSYTVIYSDNILFANAMIAPPSFMAPANVVQWIDYGPPATVSTPAGSTSRFYRVFLNP
jgi:uncharacterized repeat protein (TIGR01451 family)